LGKVLRRRRCRLGLVALDECAGEWRRTGEGLGKWGEGPPQGDHVPGPGGPDGHSEGSWGGGDRRARERWIARMRQGTDEGAVGRRLLDPIGSRRQVWETAPSGCSHRRS